MVLVVFVRPAAQTGPRYQVLFNRFQVPAMTLHIADADGKGERPLLPAPDLDYAPTFSADGQWVTFTSERDGQAEIYRVHPDGTGLQRTGPIILRSTIRRRCRPMKNTGVRVDARWRGTQTCG